MPVFHREFSLERVTRNYPRGLRPHLKRNSGFTCDLQLPPELDTFKSLGALKAVTHQVGLEAITKTLRKLVWK